MLRKLALGSLALISFAACSSPPLDSQYDTKKASDPGKLPSDTPSSFEPSADHTPAAPAGDLQGCATATSAAVQKPLFLVVVYDQSGSMKSDNKWTNAKAAMKSFFNGNDAKGMNASMTLFPATKNACQVTQYSAPQVAITALPSTAFGAALDATKPDENDLGTPTLQALTGGFNYAKSIATTSAKDGTLALVLVTDGEPNKCDGNSVDANVNLAKLNASTIPTYVVGVGKSVGNLDKIAVGGGTKAAIIAGADPAKATQDLVNAFNQIRVSALSCDYAIPAAPAGQTFDRDKVNVQFTKGNDPATAIGYSQECKNGSGWKYDDPQNPTRILACDQTCDTIKASAGKVDIVFGCATMSAPN